jgi:hypothetical protein
MLMHWLCLFGCHAWHLGATAKSRGKLLLVYSCDRCGETKTKWVS